MAVHRLVVITHDDRADTRLVESYARTVDLDIQVVRPYAGDRLPTVAAESATICLGGPMAAYDDLPFLLAEQAYLRESVEQEAPVLGICLGAQLLACALGGAAHRGAAGAETGFVDVRPLSGSRHPYLDLVQGRFFSFHGDTMRPPIDATLLAASDSYLQAWTSGSALAIQFHPELSLPGLRDFFEIEADRIAVLDLDTEACIDEYARTRATVEAQWTGILDAWLAQRPCAAATASPS